MATRTTKAEPELYLCLLAARDDREYQEALGNFLRAVRLQDVEVSARYYVNDAVGGGGGMSGEFGIIASAIGPAVCAAVGAFLAARYGRKARLKIGLDGEVEAEAQTVKQIEKLMKVAEKHRREKDSE